MTLSQKKREALAKMLRDAQKSKAPCGKLTEAAPKISVEDAYAIQSANIQRRLKKGLFGQSTRVVGHKVGLTSEAIQSWLKVDQPDFGHLLDEMCIGDGEVAPTDALLQPRIEGEIAFVLKRRLEGPGLTAADVVRATDFVLPALEIIDSRIVDWKIAYEDTIADNASSGLFVLGTKPVSLRDVDLPRVAMAMRKNGRICSTGAGVACLNNPVNAVVWLANTLGRLGEVLEPGHIVLSGALGPVAEVSAGDAYTLDISGVGSVGVRFS